MSLFKGCARPRERDGEKHCCYREVKRERGRGDTLYLFTRWDQVLVGFEDVSESFFDVLLFHA